MTLFKKLARSTVLALVLLGSAAGTFAFTSHNTVTIADTGSGGDNLDAG